MSVERRRPLSFVAVAGKGMQPTDVRQANQRALLTMIAAEPGLSNAELARRSGLAPQSVSSVLDDLETRQFVRRGDVLRGRRGQPATPLYLNPAGAFAIGAEIGWRHVEMALVGLNGEVSRRLRFAHDDPDAVRVFEQLARGVGELLAPMSNSERDRLVGLALAVPEGIGGPPSLLPRPPGQAELWAGVEPAEAAAAATGLDVTIFNSGNAACFAEMAAHPAPRPASFAFLLLDTLVAAGIVAENRLWEGLTGASASLGSMLVTDRGGATRFLSEIASLFALEARLAPFGLGLDAVGSLGAEPIVGAWTEDAAYAIAQTLFNTSRVIEFEKAVVEAALPPSVLQRLIEAINRNAGRLPHLGPAVPLVTAGHLGRSGAAEGAAQFALYRRYFSRQLEHAQD